MKQIVILSGKGGTGKTCLTAAFAHLVSGVPALDGNSLDLNSTATAVFADADVDASNLELVLEPQVLERHDFRGGQVAVIDPESCTGCGICMDVCRFDAIHETDGVYWVDPIACDGTATCVYQCPVEAIHMEEQLAGEWYRSDSRYGPLFHAELRPAQENSGKLVTLVKQQARLLALDENQEYVIVDGPPGIGCPVISASAGADLAVIVAEPTVSGVHDLQRVLQTTNHFGVPALVVINKADINPEQVAKVEVFCRKEGIEVVGHIPFDTTVTEAMVQGYPVTAYRPDSPAAQAMRRIWARVKAIANQLEGTD
ncbi:MAG TPA: (4Fe-4S)-binding protein [Anaerolineae bacterium]|nr:(4Fe-4S)-binding protein [Anaerolineae bacterium]HIQ05293.1 (4Fe-4S)-binding protein [Anaerolineae bacterium]